MDAALRTRFLSELRLADQHLTSRPAIVGATDDPDVRRLVEAMALFSAVLGGSVLLGMSGDMVEAAWGSPTRVEKLGAGNSKGEERWTYGNYLVNSAVTHLYFRNQEVVLYEFVDTQTNSTQAVSDPNEKLNLVGRAPSETGGGAKGSP